MKLKIASVLLGVFLVAGFAIGAEVEITDAEGMHNPSAVPSEAQLNEALTSGSEASTRGLWHCTAYPEGHGHASGYDYEDVHYSHAYHGAINACESVTHHHCHDVHCHYDH